MKKTKTFADVVSSKKIWEPDLVSKILSDAYHTKIDIILLPAASANNGRTVVFNRVKCNETGDNVLDVTDTVKKLGYDGRTMVFDNAADAALLATQILSFLAGTQKNENGLYFDPNVAELVVSKIIKIYGNCATLSLIERTLKYIGNDVYEKFYADNAERGWKVALDNARDDIADYLEKPDFETAFVNVTHGFVDNLRQRFVNPTDVDYSILGVTA